MGNHVIRYMIYDAVEPQYIERRLEEYAAKGFRLDHFTGRFMTFEKVEPFQARYRLDPSPMSEAEIPNDDRVTLYEDLGWNYVCNYGRYYHVYVTLDPSAPELHTDPQLHARAFRRMTLSYCGGSLFYLGLFALWAALLLHGLLKDGTPLLNWIQTGTVMIVLVLGMLLFLLAVEILQAVRFFRFVRQVQRGQDRSLRQSTFWIASRWVLLTVAVLVCCLSLFAKRFKTMTTVVSYPEYAGSLPITLADIEGDGFEYGSYFMKHTDFDLYNYVQTSKDVLAPSMILLRQYNRNDTAYLCLQIFQMRNDRLAERLMNELEQRLLNQESAVLSKIPMDGEGSFYYQGTVQEYDLLKQLNTTGDIYAYQRAENTYQFLFLREGQTLFYLCYRGTHDLREQIPLLEAWQP